MSPSNFFTADSIISTGCCTDLSQYTTAIKEQNNPYTTDRGIHTADQEQ